MNCHNKICSSLVGKRIHSHQAKLLSSSDRIVSTQLDSNYAGSKKIFTVPATLQLVVIQLLGVATRRHCCICDFRVGSYHLSLQRR